MAQSLRAALSDRNISLNHSDSLEVIAKSFGVKDWNTLSAAIQTAPPVPAQPERIKLRKTALQGFKKGATLPVVLMRDVVFSPKVILPLFVGRPKTLAALEHAMKGDGRILLITQKNPADESPDADGIYTMGVIGTVLQSLDTPNGWTMWSVQGLSRAAIMRFTGRQEFYEASVAPVVEDAGDAETIEHLSQAVRDQFNAYEKRKSPISFRMSPSKQGDIDPGYLADIVAARLNVSISEQQRILETMNIAERLAAVLDLIKQAEKAA